MHPWNGPVACASPQRGRWGGPSGSQLAAPQAAQNLAFAPRGKVALTSLVAQGVTAIDLLSSGDRPPPRALPLPPRKPQGCTCTAGQGRTAASTALLLATVAGPLVFRRRRRR